MIRLPEFDPESPIIVIDIGNSNTKVATWQDAKLKTVLTAASGDLNKIQENFEAHWRADSSRRPSAVVMGSVVPAALVQICEQVREYCKCDPMVIGDTVPLPLDVAVDDASAIGSDRVCQAAAAYDRLRAACTIVSFGTAVTIDLVDDEGTLLGGAILPGIELQLRCLHEHTAALPRVNPGFPQLPYGRNTVEAMQTGVCRGLAGAVREIVEGYATHLHRWPRSSPREEARRPCPRIAISLIHGWLIWHYGGSPWRTRSTCAQWEHE